MEEGEIVDDDSDNFDVSDETEEIPKVMEEIDSTSLLLSSQMAEEWFQKECKRLGALAKRQIRGLDAASSFGKKRRCDSEHDEQITDKLTILSKPDSLSDAKAEEREELTIRTWMQRVSKTYGSLKAANGKLLGDIETWNQEMPLSKTVTVKSLDERLEETVEKLYCTVEKYWSICREEAMEKSKKAGPKREMTIRWMTGKCDSSVQPKGVSVDPIPEKPLEKPTPGRSIVVQRPVIQWIDANSNHTAFFYGKQKLPNDFMLAPFASVLSGVSPYRAVHKKVFPLSHPENPQGPIVSTAIGYPTCATGIKQGTAKLRQIAPATIRGSRFFPQVGKGGIATHSNDFSVPPPPLNQSWNHQNQWARMPPRLPIPWNPTTNNRVYMSLQPMVQQANRCGTVQGQPQAFPRSQWPTVPPGQIPQQRFPYTPFNYPQRQQ